MPKNLSAESSTSAVPSGIGNSNRSAETEITVSPTLSGSLEPEGPAVDFTPPSPLQCNLQLLSCFICLFNSQYAPPPPTQASLTLCRGLVTAWGTFQALYTTFPSIGSVLAVSWIGSLQTFLLLITAPAVGLFSDRGYVRHLIILGTILSTLGMLLSSFLVSKFAGVLVFQGVMAGVGLGCVCTPSMVVLPAYFTRWRAVALGIATAGAGIGGVVYPLIVRHVVAAWGMAWALRVVAVVMFVTQVLPCCVLQLHPSIRGGIRGPKGEEGRTGS